MTDRQALLAAIRAHPDEDTPRLAFADLLDERGDTFFSHWAALIRTQIEAAALERFSPRWLELVQRQRELFALRMKEWTPAWDSRLGPMAYRRGFREAASFAGDGFEAAADRVFASNPIRSVGIRGLASPRGKFLSGITDYPGLAFVETLDLRENWLRWVTRFLGRAAEGMPRLRALGLGRMELSASDAADLLNLPGVGGVTALDLSENPLFRSHTHGRPETLFHAPVMDRVRWLDLSDTSTTPLVLVALGHSPRLKNLKMLNLARTVRTDPAGAPIDPIGLSGAQVLGTSPAVRGVEYLDLTGHWLGANSVRALATSLSNVRELLLAGNDLGDEGAAVLAECSQFGNLRRLELDGNRITTLGTAALLASPHLQNLTVLDGVPTTPEFLARFGRFPPVVREPLAVNSEPMFRPCP
jgi:uncharacterized protein (TIGR02996 family)